MITLSVGLIRISYKDRKSTIYSQVGQILFLKREGLFNVFPNFGKKVIKSATKEEICSLICPS
jgi:hypothetical protein